MAFTQVYDPLGNAWLSTLLASVPIVLLLGLLATGRVPAHVAAFAGLLGALATAVFAYVPAVPEAESYGERVARWTPTVLAAAANGAAFGLVPIGWIVLSAIFLYQLTVATGKFEIVKHSVAALSDDRRIQALLIAFCFGAFVEGAAGFGTPVAISAALLMGTGFKPKYAAGLALIANTSPVAFGALGTPILTLANVTQLSEFQLSAMAGRQLPFFSLIIPVWLVWVMSGWRGVRGVWPALVVCGGSFALVQFLVANYHGPWLVDVAGGVISLVCLAVFLRFWQPRKVWRFEDEPESNAVAPAKAKTAMHSRREIASAWVPWVLLAVFVFIWGLQEVKTVLGMPTKDERKEFQSGAEMVENHSLRWRLQVPALHKRVAREKPVVPVREEENAVFELPWLATTGTGIFFAAVVSAVYLRVGWKRFVQVFAETLYKMIWPLFTIATMLAIAFVTRYSGMDATLGLAFTRTGALFPFFAAMLGWLGVALTGSDTSSNALFGSLQTITAGRLVQEGALSHLTVEQASILLASANSTGGVMGKMIDAQSIVVAAVATGQKNQEGPILRFVFWHSLVLAALMGLLVLFQAYVWTSAIPA